MLEVTTPLRKNKINLSDYNCEQDIYNRTLMSSFSAFDLQILNEILFSSLKISLKKFCRSLGASETHVLPILESLSKGGLLSIQEDNILVDKEIRKYFEFQMTRFDPDFKPDMEFLQALLKKVPIQYLPTWHAISRTSNNIFESIVEKYLLSPQIFQRYLNELKFDNPIISSIISDLFFAPDFKITSTDVISKYNLSRHHFEEIILLLEFSFICCLTYEKQEDHWIEYVAPFHEWHQYLRFLKQTETHSIASGIAPKSERNFFFIENMSSCLEFIQKKELTLNELRQKSKLSQGDFDHTVEKLCMLKFTELRQEKLHFLQVAEEWLKMSLEERALYLYRYPLNKLLNPNIPDFIASDRNIREAEKSIKRVLRKEWVFFDDFVKGVLVALSEESVIMLKKSGKQWKYTLPSYSESEKSLLKAVIFEWLFEMGMTIPGICQGRDCFLVTPFGKFFFDE